MRTFTLIVPALLVGAVLSGCTGQSELAALQAQVNRQEQQLKQLSAMRPAQADTWAQVQQLRQEMASMQGEMDNFNHTSASVGGLDGIVARLNRHQQALQRVNTQFALDLNLDEPVAATPAVPSLTGKTAAPAAAPAAEEKVGSATVRQLAETVPAPAPAVSAKPAARPAPVAPAAPKAVSKPAPQVGRDTSTVLYETGIASFNKRKYKDALQSFSDFTATYRKHPLIGNAHFWRGESNFALARYSAAVLDYEQVISHFPKNGKAASCYLKQGISFIRLGNKDAARVRLQDTVKKFPKTPEAARAKSLLAGL